MASNSLNLIELTKGYLTGDFKNRLSSLLGESRDENRIGTQRGGSRPFLGTRQHSFNARWRATARIYRRQCRRRHLIQYRLDVRKGLS